MDPNLFHVDGERLMEVLFMIVVLSFFVERALAPFFESRFFIKRFQEKSLKEVIAFAVGALICWQWQFDALSILLVQDTVSVYGSVITGAIIAGGSKASVKLFRDMMGIASKAEQARTSEKLLGKIDKSKKEEAKTPVTQ